MQELTLPVMQIIGGCCGLIVCMALYLAWWCITFKPEGGGKSPLGIVCIVIATLAGIAGVAFTAMGVSGLPDTSSTFPNWYFVVAGLIVYVVLIFVTYLWLKRPLTTELFLIVGWAVLELHVINSTFCAGIVAAPISIVLIVLLAIGFVASMVCYTLYYKLPPKRSYIDGMVPLIVAAVYQVVLILVLV